MNPCGIQGLEGRFRVRPRFAGSMRARPASAATATMRASSARGGDDNDTLVPPRRRAGARARPPLRTLRS